MRGLTHKFKVGQTVAAGLTLRAISAETGIPVGAVHRAKRQLETARTGQQPAARATRLPCYRAIGGAIRY